MEIDIVLSAIGRTEPSTFNEFCSALGDDCPEKGDRKAWGEVFKIIESGERSGLIDVDRVRGKIDSMRLTEAGAARVRAKLDSKRGLLGYIESR